MRTTAQFKAQTKGQSGAQSKAASTVLMVATIAVLSISLAGCDEAEQGRILRYEKGTYLGKADTEVSPEMKNELRYRATMQRGM
jgi:uncharacterized lipoprotein YehR (DUF1307 family)